MRSKYLPKKSVGILRSNIPSDSWLPFEIMLETGLRCGDVVKLRRADVVDVDGQFHLRFKAEKTGKDGSAPISAPLARALRSRVRSGYLFPGRKPGSHLSRQALWRRIKTACEKAGIDAEGVSPHSFRKDFAVDLMHREGLSAVQKALQHDNNAVTRVYAYADTIMNSDSDEPVRWRDIELLVGYVLERLKET